MRISLEPISGDDHAQCHEAVEFINRHYRSELPTEVSSITSGRIKLFWAQCGELGGRVGITGYMPKTPFLAESVKTVVDPAFRGKGLGPLLSQAIEDEVRRAGFKKIMSTIYITNIPMIVIKLKAGYVIEGTHFDHEKPGLHEYSLGKRLS